jgi:glycine cleavage system aminomethyltransferase T
MNSSAQVLLVGAGIVGCSTAYHRARLGVADVSAVEQGPLFATGGSGSHAPGLVFQTNPSETMSRLAAYPAQCYAGLELDGRPCFHQVGGIEVAATPQRWEDLKRKLGLATAWGIRGEVLDARQVHDRIPQLDPARIHGGLQVPTEGMNGLFLFTADGMPVLGPSNEIDNFWVAEAVWITHAAGPGRATAQWLTGGVPDVDLRQADLRRFEDFAHSPSYVGERGAQSFCEVYDIIHPQPPPERQLRTSPFHGRRRELAAVFPEANGWERPHCHESKKSLVDGRDIVQPGSWAGRHWSPIVGAEHQANRERVAMYDMTSLPRAEVTGRGALELLQQMQGPTPDIQADITVARLERDVFQVGCNGPRDIAWLRRHADETTHVRDITGGTCCIGLWGLRARDVLAELADRDVSHEAFRFFRAKRLFVGEVPVLAPRLSYVGEPGWELYTSAEFGRRLWDLLATAGAEHGTFPGGRGAFNGPRLEKGYRAWGADMWNLHDPDEALLAFAVKADKGEFIGRDALLRRRERDPQRWLCCPRIDDGTALMGSEPVFADGAPVGFTTSAGYGDSAGASLAHAWPPTGLSEPGTPVRVSYFEQRHPATVVADPVSAPEMTRMRC